MILSSTTTNPAVTHEELATKVNNLTKSSSNASDTGSSPPTLLHIDSLSEAHLVRPEDKGILLDIKPLLQPATFYGVGQGTSHEIGVIPGLAATA